MCPPPQWVRSAHPFTAGLLPPLLPHSSFNQGSSPLCPQVPHLPLANIINHLCSSALSLAHDLPHPNQPHSRRRSHHTEPKLLNLETDTVQSRKLIHLYTAHGAPNSSNRPHCQPTWLFPGPAEDQQSSARSACAVLHLSGKKGPGTLVHLRAG